jgi:hypothetical protein
LRAQSDVAPSQRRPPAPPPSFGRADERAEVRGPSSIPARPAARAVAAAAVQDPFPVLEHDWDVPAFQRKPMR